jgi:hypothetical protein
MGNRTRFETRSETPGLAQPAELQGPTNRFEHFRCWLAREYGVVLAMDVPFRKEPAFAYFDADGVLRYQPVCYRSPLLWTFVGNAIDISRTFDTFVRGLQGGPRDDPTPSKRYAGHAALSVLVVAGMAVGLGIYANAFYGTFAYRASVANDVVLREIKDVLPIPGALKAVPTTYNGRAVQYDFSLDPEWKPLAVPSGMPNVEYLLDYRALGKLEVDARAGVSRSDVYDEALPAEVRNGVEATVRKEVPNASVKLLGSRWLSVNGVQWREVTLEQNYGTVLAETRRVLYYPGRSSWIAVTIILPNHRYYTKVSDEIVSTLHVPRSNLDELLIRADGEPVLYRGKKIRYRLSLPPAWKAIEFAKSAGGPDESGQKLKALAEQTSELREYTFELGSPRFADLEVLLGDSPEDLRNLAIYFESYKAVLSQLLGSIMPDFRTAIEHLNHRNVTVGGREWGEIEARVTVSKDDFLDHFKIIQRVTNREGRALYLTAQIRKEHPTVRTVVLRALDTFRFEE